MKYKYRPRIVEIDDRHVDIPESCVVTKNYDTDQIIGIARFGRTDKGIIAEVESQERLGGLYPGVTIQASKSELYKDGSGGYKWRILKGMVTGLTMMKARNVDDRIHPYTETELSGIKE